jgi:hypothetical protein
LQQSRSERQYFGMMNEGYGVDGSSPNDEFDTLGEMENDVVGVVWNDILVVVVCVCGCRGALVLGFPL